jgi:hypothetical protein
MAAASAMWAGSILRRFWICRQTDPSCFSAQVENLAEALTAVSFEKQTVHPPSVSAMLSRGCYRLTASGRYAFVQWPARGHWSFCPRAQASAGSFPPTRSSTFRPSTFSRMANDSSSPASWEMKDRDSSSSIWQPVNRSQSPQRGFASVRGPTLCPPMAGRDRERTRWALCGLRARWERRPRPIPGLQGEEWPVSGQDGKELWSRQPTFTRIDRINVEAGSDEVVPRSPPTRSLHPWVNITPDGKSCVPINQV